MQRVSFMLFAVLLLATAGAQAVDLKLPWSSDETWVVTVQYGGYCGSGCQDDYHTNAANAYYALDFDKPGVAEGSGLPILAAAGGTVEFAGGNPLTGFGYYVKINHGNGYKTLYGHLKEWPMVATNDEVDQGEQIGKLGSTGWAEGDHLHFVLYYNGNCLSTEPNSKPEPISGYTGIVYGQSLTSDNNGQTFLATQTGYHIEPDGPYTPGQTIECWVYWRNDGSATWSNTIY